MIAVDGKPTTASLDDQLSQMPPGTTVHLRVENRKGQREVKLQLGLREQQTYELQDLPVGHSRAACPSSGMDPRRR